MLILKVFTLKNLINLYVLQVELNSNANLSKSYAYTIFCVQSLNSMEYFMSR